MRTPPLLVPVLFAAALSACGPSSKAVNGTAAADPANQAAAAPALTEADYAGRWVGVEGMYMTITARDGGGLAVENQWDLDNKGFFDAVVTEEGLRFTRNGRTLIARMSDGDATGLKWLAGKRHCLTVRKGEGYCRS